MLRCGTGGTKRITLPEPQWYVAKHRHQIGPMPEAKIVRNIHTGSADPTALVFIAWMSNRRRGRQHRPGRRRAVADRMKGLILDHTFGIGDHIGGR